MIPAYSGHRQDARATGGDRPRQKPVAAGYRRDAWAADKKKGFNSCRRILENEEG